MTLKLIVKCGYGVGHVTNDLCSAIWFTYLLIFYELVMGFSTLYSGSLMLIGQISDALATPLIGYLCDKGPVCCVVIDLRRRKSWYLFGSLLVLVSFPFLFLECIGCSKSPDHIRFIYYVVFITIFQIGWAAAQIAHLAMAPDLTPKEHERTMLMSLRTAFTVLSGLFVYLMAFFLFHFGSRDDDEVELKPSDITKFKILMVTSLAIGTVASVFFYFTVKENMERLLQLASEAMPTVSYKQLFSKASLYQLTVVYMAARVFCNVSQSMLPLYLNMSLQLDKSTIASVPFVMFASSFIGSLASAPLNQYLGRKVSFLIGAILSFGAAAWIRFDTSPFYKYYFVYFVTVLVGLAAAVFLVTSLAAAGDLIGNDINNGAFLYGVLSFADKTSCGLVIMGIQGVRKHFGRMYYRDVLAYTCALSAAIGLIFIVTMKRVEMASSSTSLVQTIPQEKIPVSDDSKKRKRFI